MCCYIFIQLNKKIPSETEGIKFRYEIVFGYAVGLSAKVGTFPLLPTVSPKISAMSLVFR